MSHPEDQDLSLCKYRGNACPVVKTLSAVVAVIVFVLTFYIPWNLGEIKDAQELSGKVSGIESKLDMVLMILKGEVNIAKDG